MRDDTWVYRFFVHVVDTLPDLSGFFSTLTVPTQGNKKLCDMDHGRRSLDSSAPRR